MIALRVVLFAALALCTACRVGEPLVDRRTPPLGDPIPVVSCEDPMPCEEPLMLELASSEPKALKWQPCPTLCDGDSSLGCVPLDPLHELAADLTCETKRFTASATALALAAGADVKADDVHWESSNVVIEADAPLEVVISDAELRDTRVELVGPITLRFQGGTTLVGVSISSTAASARVVFDGVDPNDLIVGDATQPFPGHMEARHSAMAGVSAVVESMELDSVMIDDAYISARDLVSNDGALSAATLDVGHATFAPASLLNVAIAQCETLSFFGSELRSVVMPRCIGEPTRLYATDVITSRIDGRISGDSGKLENVQIGVSEPSELELWSMKVGRSAFCDHVESFKVGRKAVTCSLCSPAAFDPLEKGCILPREEDEEDQEDERPANFCEALDLLEPCPPPLPMRTRPIDTLN